jgi:hypothetical protein
MALTMNEMRQVRSWRERRNPIVALTFLLCLFAPGVLGMFHVTGLEQFTERRLLAEPPQFQWDLKKYVNDLDLFVSDHFGLRPLFIASLGFAKLLIGVSANPRVLIGNDGWLFMLCGPCLSRQEVYSQHDVESFATAFIERQLWVEARGSYFTFLIGPRKELVYPEHLPEWSRPVGPDMTIEDLRKAFQLTNMDVVYPIEAMLAAKRTAKLYYRYDTHWTYPGAFVAAKALINHLHERDARVAAFNDDDFTLSDAGYSSARYDGGQLDLLTLIGVPFPGERSANIDRRGGWTAKQKGVGSAIVYTKDDPSLPTIVVYSDSYGVAMQRFVAEYFRRSVFIDAVHGPLAAGHEFPTALLLAEKPDFFVYVRAEVHIPAPTTNPPELHQPGQAPGK